MLHTFENNQLILKPQGKIMMDRSDTIKNEMKALIEKTKEQSPQDFSKVIVDLSSVDFIDSTGVGVFISIYKFSTEKEFHLTLVNPMPMVEKVFTITKLEQIIDIQSNGA
ncbi:STAS domain-containing protein [Vallitaleaceae bacterium 9-2]